MINLVSIAGGVGGWLGGTAAGAAIGLTVRFVGTAIGGGGGGILGSLVGTAASRRLAQSSADKLVKNDAEALIKVIEKEMQRLSLEYMLSEGEVEQVIAVARNTANTKWLRHMYKETGGREELGRRFVRGSSSKSSRKSPSGAKQSPRRRWSAFTASYRA